MRWCSRLLFLMLALASSLAHADKPLTLFKTWTGNVNFTGAVATNRYDTNPCNVYGANSNTAVTATLAGIPASATILSAQLYWAGSGATADYTVNFEAGNVTSTAARSYSTTFTLSTTTLNYFSGAVDVTTQVQARRNGTYTFYGLSVNSSDPYCSSSAVLSGFSLLVVYSDSSQPFRVLSLFEGFQDFRNANATYRATGFRVPASLTSSITGRIGHITWEGDPDGTGSENLSYNGTKMVDSVNPVDNQFNSKSNINGSITASGVDFDAYDVASPVIATGQTSAAALYASGNDLVLSSAVLVAAPSDPLVDLSVTITRNGAFQTGTAGTYTLSVYNAGPYTENGPITIVTTLPANLTYVSATGTRSTCSVSGKVVTCIYNGLFTPNTYLPDITVTVLPTAEGSTVTTTTVSGVGYDIATANNSATDTTTVTKGAFTYAFTDSACKVGVAFGTTGQCNILTADMRIQATTSVTGYLTVVSGGVPTARSTTAATTVPVYFAMTCVLPLKNAGVKAIVNSITMPLCADGPNAPAATSTAWSTAVTLPYAANSPSSAITFVYADVGRLQLYVKELAGNASSSPTIISRPDKLRITVTNNPSPVSSTTAPFVAAGVPFSVKVDAQMLNGSAAPNFGNGDASIALSIARPLAATSADDKAINAAMSALPNLLTTGMDTGSGGAFNGTATFSEVGVILLTADIAGGGYFGVDDVTDVTVRVGRFYPYSFKTIVTPFFPSCADTVKYACPTGVPGAVYATQGFDVGVTPIDANDNELVNYRGVLGNAITLSAFDTAGGAIENPPASPTGATLTGKSIPALAATGTNALLHVTSSYFLPVPFLYSKPVNSAWTLPTPIFLRATANDVFKKSDGTSLVVITSKQSDTTLEGGIMILNGRLRLSTVAGSELLRLPVLEQAQFWNKIGTAPAAWYTNLLDTGATPTTIAFSSCKRNLLVSTACYSGLAMTPKDTAFTKGAANFFIAAPGAGRTGSAMFMMTGAPAWLPSTLAQAVFGFYKSNLIYLRELY